MRHTVPARMLVSHTQPLPARMESPPSPKNCCATLFVAGSMRVIGYSNEVAHTEPSPAEISPPPPGMPASMVATTLLVLMSTRVIEPSPWLSVHTEPSPTVRKRGFGPTAIVSSMTLVWALTRVSTFFSALVTHTALPPKATAYEPDAT